MLNNEENSDELPVKLIFHADDRMLLGVHCFGDITPAVVGLGHVLRVDGSVEWFLDAGEPIDFCENFFATKARSSSKCCDADRSALSGYEHTTDKSLDSSRYSLGFPSLLICCTCYS
jgi:hypothetical protein